MILSPEKAGVMTVISKRYLVIKWRNKSVKYRGDRLTRKMGSAKVGVVGDQHVTTFEFAFPDSGLGPHTGRHAAEMDRKMWSFIYISTTHTTVKSVKYEPFATSPPSASNKAQE